MTLYHTNQGFDLVVPVLLIDGYYVCGYWPNLKKCFSKGILDVARQNIIDELILFSAIKGVKVVVVFDAMVSDLPTHKETFMNVDIIFTTDASADAWIEKEVAALKEYGCPKVWLAISYSCQQQVAHGAGTYIWRKISKAPN